MRVFPKWRRRRGKRAFTLIELIVVLAIIGLLASITLPAMKGMRQSNSLASANRQLLDDIGAARQRAIKDGSTVLMIFVPPASAADAALYAPLNSYPSLKTNLLRYQQNHYALYSDRAAGDQPGRRRPRYLPHGQVWRALPDGLFIPAWKFPDKNGAGGANVPPFGFIPPFDRISGVPIPTINYGVTTVPVPYLAFDSRGRLVKYDATDGIFKLATKDAIIPLARGSIFLARDANGALLWDTPDIAEKPPGNSVDNYNLIIIDKLTGRARVENPRIQ